MNNRVGRQKTVQYLLIGYCCGLVFFSACKREQEKHRPAIGKTGPTHTIEAADRSRDGSQARSGLIGFGRPTNDVPEVLQSSPMDCGPAVLRSVLKGYGLDVDYDKLKAMVQVDSTGTNIDLLEDVAVELGLDAVQTMVPVENLLISEAELLPAIVVFKSNAKQPDPNTVTKFGAETHFVVAWRTEGGKIQTMDPSVGRRWISNKELISRVYVHSMPAPTKAVSAHLRSDSFLEPLKRRMQNLGIAKIDRTRLVAKALDGTSWRGVAALDAAICWLSSKNKNEKETTTTSRHFQFAKRYLSICMSGANKPCNIPSDYWYVTASAKPSQVVMRGAVAVTVRGRRSQDH